MVFYGHHPIIYAKRDCMGAPKENKGQQATPKLGEICSLWTKGTPFVAHYIIGFAWTKSLRC